MEKIFFALWIFLLFGCSLKYEQENDFADDSPEMEFRGVQYRKYEDEKISMEVRAEILEQYKNDGRSFGKNAFFKTWDSDEKIVAEGGCDFLGINPDTKIHMLFGGIEIKNLQDDFCIRAESLRWNENSMQLTGGKNEKVTVLQDDVEISGTGFSASGVSQKFSFASAVDGKINSGGENESE